MGILKRVIICFLAFVLIFSLTSCRKKGNDTSSYFETDDSSTSDIVVSQDEVISTPSENVSSDSSSEKQNSSENKYTVAAKGSEYANGIYLPKLTAKQAKITYMTNTDWNYIVSESTKENPTAIYHAMKVWKETYGVDVQIELVPWDNFDEFLITSVTSGEGPDVMRYFYHPLWVNNNLCSSLNDKMDLSDPDYDSKRMNEYSINKKIYSIYSKPVNMPDNLILYNKTKFQQAGEKTPMQYYKSGEWTFTQFAKTAKRLTNVAEDEYGFTGYGLYPTSYPLVVLNSDRTVSLKIDDTNYVKWLTSRVNVYRDGGARFEDKGAVNYMSTFPSGKDAMVMVDGKTASQIIEIAKKNGNKDKYEIAPLPSNDMIGETLPRGSNESYLDGFAMSSHPKNQTGAVEFLRLVTKIGTNIAKSSGEFGALTNSMSNEDKQVFRAIKYQDIKYITNGGIDGMMGISSLENLRNQYLMPLLYSTNTNTVQSALSAIRGPLQAAIKEYEINIGLKK